MHPVLEFEEDVLTRLETRLDQLGALVARLKERTGELQRALDHVAEERDQAIRASEEARAATARMIEENDALRARQKEAAGRVRRLLQSLEQIDLSAEA
jgi:peptidoglycan hydrolase CwlO-like protein